MRHAVVPGRCIETQGWFVGIRRQRYLRRKESVQGWPQEERDAFLLLGNLHPDQFLTLLCSCFICLRTPRLRRRVCFGIGITRPGSTGRGQRKRPQARWSRHLIQERMLRTWWRSFVTLRNTT